MTPFMVLVLVLMLRQGLLMRCLKSLQDFGKDLVKEALFPPIDFFNVKQEVSRLPLLKE